MPTSYIATVARLGIGCQFVIIEVDYWFNLQIQSQLAVIRELKLKTSPAQQLAITSVRVSGVIIIINIANEDDHAIFEIIRGVANIKTSYSLLVQWASKESERNVWWPYLGLVPQA